jgi:nicotinamidase-related amidase
MIKAGEDISALRAAFRQGALAHICIDVQDFYCDPEHPGAAHFDAASIQENMRVAARISGFLDKTRRRLPPVWVAHDIDEAFAESTTGLPLGRRHRAEALRDKFYAVAPRKNEALVCKHSYDAFLFTNLAAQLEARNVKAVLLSGIFLQCCVAQTALGARREKYDAYIMTDLCSAGSMAEAEIRRGMKDLEKRGVKFITSAEACDAIRPARRLAHG